MTAMTEQAKKAMACGGCQQAGCRLCDLYATNVKYRNHWDGAPAKKPSETWECVHRGQELRRETCPSCKGTVQVKVFRCVPFEECQIQNYIKGVRACSLCDSRVK